jgi:hypothetical protein
MKMNISQLNSVYRLKSKMEWEKSRERQRVDLSKSSKDLDQNHSHFNHLLKYSKHITTIKLLPYSFLT